jgi:hypothetical protein
MRVFKTFSGILDQGYWFSDYRVSAFASQRTGGIDQIDYHGQQPVSHNAKIFQSEDGVIKFSLLIKRNGTIEERPFQYGKVEVYPHGFINFCKVSGLNCTLALTIYRRVLLFRLGIGSPRAEGLEVAFNMKLSLASQCTDVHGTRTWDQPRLMEGNSLLFHAADRLPLVEWVEQKGDYLVNEGWQKKIFDVRTTPEGETIKKLKPRYKQSKLMLYDADIFAVIGGRTVRDLEMANGWAEFKSGFGAVKSSAREIRSVFVLAFGDTLQEARSDFASALASHRLIEDRQRKRYAQLESPLPRLKLKGYPEVEGLFRVIPQVVESAKISEAGMTRACPSSYYWVWGWDNLVTGLEFAKWGDVEYLRKMVEFFRTHRSLDGSTPVRWTRNWEPMDSRGFGGADFLYVSLVMELYNQTRDKSVLQKCYPSIKFIFDSLAKQANESGFFKTIGMYPDFPQRLGRNNNSYVAQDEGAWYCICRLVEIVSYVLGDELTSKRARNLAGTIKENYLDEFFGRGVGFLSDSIDSRTNKRIKTYTLYTLLFLHSSVGFSLIADREDEIGDFVRANFFQEHGIGMTPKWDKFHGSEISTASWYPHWDACPVKLLRRLGKTDALLRWLGLVKDCYRRLGYCPELVSLKPEDIDPDKRWMHHGSPWNLNSATGWYKALVEGIVGIESDIGGLTYIPCALPFDAELSGLHFRKTVWNIKTSGRGDYVEAFIVDGVPMVGTYKIPCQFYSPGLHTLTIRYGSQRKDGIVLKELRDAELLRVQASGKNLDAMVNCLGTSEIVHTSPAKPEVHVDGVPISVTWTKTRPTGTFAITSPGRHSIRIEAP